METKSDDEKGTEVTAEKKKYSKYIYYYDGRDGWKLPDEARDIPFKMIMRFDNSVLPGSHFYWVQWIMSHDRPFQDIGHPPHIHRDPELLLFVGGDPHNPTELNAEVEYYMGVELERYVLTKSCVIYIPFNIVHSPMKPLYAKHPWISIEVNQGPTHTEKGYHQILKPEQWNSPDLMKPSFADDKY